MATRTGYFGQPTAPSALVNYLWNAEAWNSSYPEIVTCIKKNASATYNGATSKYPNDNQVITLDADEYLTGISFSGNILYNMNAGSRQACCCVCDSNGQNFHLLIPWDTMVEGDYGYITPSQANKSGQSWTDLAGKTIALGKMQGDAYAIYQGDHHVTVTLTTAYLNKTITINKVGPGTATLSSNQCTRGQAVTLTLTPVIGYKVGNVIATGGTLTRITSNTYTFTMPTPAQNITITVNFNPVAFQSKVGEIIYAEWYNQE